jgi:hypothetical protein
MSLLQTIDNICKSPKAFFGPAQFSFSALIGFLSGYASASTDCRIGRSSEDDILRFGFHSFVRRNMQPRFPDRSFGSGLTWTNVIARDTGSDKEAFELFVDLWTRFRKEHTPD